MARHEPPPGRPGPQRRPLTFSAPIAGAEPLSDCAARATVCRGDPRRVIGMGATSRSAERATGYCLIPFSPERTLELLSGVLRESGVNLAASRRAGDRIVGRIGRAWSPSACRVSVEVYPHPGASFVEITCESRRNAAGMAPSALVDRLARAATDTAVKGKAAPDGTTPRGAPALYPKPIKMNAKVCLVGESGVGKTSLIRRFVLDVYGDAYVKTIGTKVTRREVLVFPPNGPPVNVNLLIWDIMGDKGFRDILQRAYFAGARGVLAVADVTRAPTLGALESWIESAKETAESVPVLIAGNKSDLSQEAQVVPGDLEDFANDIGGSWMATSAKTGDNVAGAFRRLAVTIAAELLRGTGDAAPAGNRVAP